MAWALASAIWLALLDRRITAPGAERSFEVCLICHLALQTHTQAYMLGFKVHKNHTAVLCFMAPEKYGPEQGLQIFLKTNNF